MTFYRRRLPHWHPHEKSFFVTWRLHGSLPNNVRARLRIASDGDFPIDAFAQVDRLLDHRTDGPLWLRDPQFADMVVATLLRGERPLDQYRLHAYVVMANHVHVLLTPHLPLERIMRTLKGVTARKANAMLGRAGERFWQEESFDHWIRSEGSFDRIVRYIENNPVAAGLVNHPEAWKWSSAHR